MATLNQLQNSPGDDPILITEIDNSSIQVEPLGGPLTIDQLMDRFPDNIYDTSSDSHLYRFMNALCGDAGAGILKNQAYFTRLINEGQHLTYTDLDTFYVQNFRFERLKSELYPTDPITNLPLDPADILTTTQWDQIESRDKSYQQRMMDYMNATRIGNTPDGIKLAAKGATGQDIEVIENYKAVYDTYSDDPLSIQLQGTTLSTNEFILTPRIVDGSGNVNTDVGYQANLEKTYNPGTNITTWGTATQTYLNPDIEHNMVELVDRIRPANSLMTITATDIHYVPVAITSVQGSSARFRLIRFVTGAQNVGWPAPSSSDGYFVQAGIEAEATYQPTTIIDMPNIYQTIDNIIAYENFAIQDPTYNTSAFLAGTLSPFLNYRSEHFGGYYPVISGIFTFLKNAPNNFLYDAEHALADNNTAANLVGRINTNGNE